MLEFKTVKEAYLYGYKKGFQEGLEKGIDMTMWLEHDYSNTTVEPVKAIEHDSTETSSVSG